MQRIDLAKGNLQLSSSWCQTLHRAGSGGICLKITCSEGAHTVLPRGGADTSDCSSGRQEGFIRVKQKGSRMQEDRSASFSRPRGDSSSVHLPQGHIVLKSECERLGVA